MYMQPSFIQHTDIYRGGLQFRRISTLAQKYFDTLPFSSHGITLRFPEIVNKYHLILMFIDLM